MMNNGVTFYWDLLSIAIPLPLKFKKLNSRNTNIKITIWQALRLVKSDHSQKVCIQNKLGQNTTGTLLEKMKIRWL